MERLDLEVVDLFQWLYNQLLDRFGLKIGTFRMSIALFPIAADTLGKTLYGNALATIIADCIFLVGVSLFYNIRMMISDDKLQIRHKLRPINARSISFRSKYFNVRIFYLFFFVSSAIFHHNVACLGLLSIVYARCLLVRERMKPQIREMYKLKPA